MILGIVGLPNCGKTALFNALTGGSAEVAPYAQSGAEPNVGTVKVPDSRVDSLSGIFKPKKTVHATVEVVDLPGLPRGSVADGARVTDFLKRAREVDALVHVVRAFADEGVAHPSGSVDPLRDFQDLETELMLSDLGIIEKRLERLDGALKKGVERARHGAEQKTLMGFRQALEEEQPLRAVSVTPDEEKMIRGYRFLTRLPVVVVLNIHEGAFGSAETEAWLGRVRDRCPGATTRAVVLSAKIEMEIAQLPREEAKLFLEDLGIEVSAMELLIRTCYELLGLISFLTVGDDEVRAWTLHRGTAAVRAAGVIHSDMERGFIKAEVIGYDAFMEAGSFTAARERGTLRLEGKDYPVADGDIINFKFNV